MSGLRRKAKSGNPSSSLSSSKKAKKSIDLGWKRDVKKNNNKNDDNDDEIESDDENQFFGNDREHEMEPPSSDEEKETVDAKRVRLAREYLDKLEARGVDESSSEEGSDDDDDDDDEDDDTDGDENEQKHHHRIGRKLQRDRLKKQGLLQRDVAQLVAQNVKSLQNSIISKPASQGNFEVNDAEQQAEAWIKAGKVTLLRGHDLTPTSVALQADGERALSGSKDNSVILWDVERGQKLHYLCPAWKKSTDKQARNNGEVLSVACSDDGRFAAVGRHDATVQIFDIRISSNKYNLLNTFRGHKGPITCLAFRTQSSQLFSGSDDRCIRQYNLDEMTYLETLYGHQAGITAMDCHRKERPVSVGMDRTARVWKLADDTHLIFRGGAKVSSADCVSAIKDDWFVTGHDDGNLSLWMTEKKKAVVIIDQAHGSANHALTGRGIVSVGGLKGSDMIASGSSDGYMRLWKIMTGSTLAERGMEQIGKIPVHGFINGIAMGPRARFCVVAVGQEPRLGRWERVPRAKNRFGIIQLRAEDNDTDSDASPEVSSNVPYAGDESVGSEDEGSD